jgi:hypothetical protein
VLVVLAMMGSRPTQMSAGNESSVPPPATELIMPAIKAAAKMTISCQIFIES